MPKPRRPQPATPKPSARRSNASRLAALSTAVPQVVAHRVARMALAGPVLSARDRKEFTGMVVEKQLALAQAWSGMTAEALRQQQQLWLACFTGKAPSAAGMADALLAQALKPLERKASANARRLARTRLR